MDPVLGLLGVAARELALFAGVGFVLLGLSDLAVDLLWIGLRIRRRLKGPFSVPARSGEPGGDTFAIFVPAWDESGVVADMLTTAMGRFGEADYRLYVGCYPNDPATIAAVEGVGDPRIRLVVVDRPGPTTKAHCLNMLWAALGEDEAAGRIRTRAIVLHDAEDVVHSGELAAFRALLDRFDFVQLPVLPLIDPHSRWIAGHYAEEFAESHGKEMVVREAIGAAFSLAGVGCAIHRDAMAWVAALSDGLPFDEASLTEDYELGLKLHMLGARGTFARIPSGAGLVVTRGYFPSGLAAAVRQKARWTVGIALSGWDRLGWRGGVAETWMRLRDRQALLAALLLLAGYLALLAWTLLLAIDVALGLPPTAGSPALTLLLQVNAGLLLWRLSSRFGFVAAAYGWREGLRSIPRVVVGNIVAMMAARQAVARYGRLRRGAAVQWGKTHHVFPATLPAE